MNHDAPRPAALSLRTVPDLPVRHDSTLELVDSDFMVAALDSRWDTVAGAPTRRADLLLLDPGEHWAPGIMQALAEATGAPLGRVRVLSPVGLREIATLDEIRLPPTPGLPSIVRLLRARRLDGGPPSPALARVWLRTRLAVLLGHPGHETEAARWLLMLAAHLRRQRDTSPPWLVFGPTLARDTASRVLPQDPWLEGLQFAPAPQAAAASAVWNAIVEAWQRVP